jgi:hypothetical protein
MARKENFKIIFRNFWLWDSFFVLDSRKWEMKIYEFMLSYDINYGIFPEQFFTITSVDRVRNEFKGAKKAL